MNVPFFKNYLPLHSACKKFLFSNQRFKYSSCVSHYRDQITLKKFLGSGAFGEVFEGTAKGLNGGISNVAVKVFKYKGIFLTVE